MRRLVFLAVLATLAAGCGDSKSSSNRTTSSSTATTQTLSTTTTQQTVAIRVYFLRDGKVGPVLRRVPATRAVARAALTELVAGPTTDERVEGFTTRVPAHLALGPPTLEGDTLDLGASPNLDPEESAQIVYTMTQFPAVHRVRLGALVFTRAAFEDQTPAILVESPLPGETVSSPIRIRGTANTFEATFEVELRDASRRRISGHFVTATSGSGERGTFDTTVAAPSASGHVTLVVYEVSAANGQRINEVRIPLVVG
jgi:hypothetical protein